MGKILSRKSTPKTGALPLGDAPIINPLLHFPRN